MKRIFLFFLLVLGVFTLVACDNTKYTITYELDGGTLTNEVTSFTKKDLPVTLPTPTRDGYVFLGWYLDSEFSGEPVTKITEAKNVTVYAKWISELEKLDNEIKAIIEAYKNALQGSVRFEAGPDSDVLVTELKYIFKEENNEKILDQLMVKQTQGNEEWSLYIKDKVAYINNEGEKVKENLTDNDLKVKIQEFGFAAFIEDVEAIFDENFYAAATIQSKTDSKVIVELDLDKYDGSLNVSGEITKLELVVDFTNNQVSKITVNVTRNQTVYFIKVTFVGTSNVQIEFPIFNDYK